MSLSSFLARPDARPPVEQGPTSPLPTRVGPPPQRSVSSPSEVAHEGLPEGAALLLVTRGPQAGSRYVLVQDTTTAGRNGEADICLDDVTVSRCHAEFRRVGRDVVLLDVGSFNGTYLNRSPVDSAVLVDGDEVQIGRFRLTFLAGAPSPLRIRPRGVPSSS